jgi:hypothetical protein
VDIEKTIEFLLAQQAKFETGMEELRQSQQATERLINAFAKAGAAQIELHRARLDSVERRLDSVERQREADEQRFQAFLDRFDAFLRGQRGDGHSL